MMANCDLTFHTLGTTQGGGMASVYCRTHGFDCGPALFPPTSNVCAFGKIEQKIDNAVEKIMAAMNKGTDP
jgi:hypothetical protein